MRFDGYRFSDGTVLSWNLRSDASPRVRTSSFKQRLSLSREHENAILSNVAIPIRMDAVLVSKTAVLPGPVRAKDFIAELRKFFRRRLTSREKRTFSKTAWARGMKNWKNVTTVADVLGDHVHFEGIDSGGNVMLGS